MLEKILIAISGALAGWLYTKTPQRLRFWWWLALAAAFATLLFLGWRKS